MDTAIVVAIITVIGVIITALCNYRATSNKLNETQNKITNELSTQNQLQNNEINHIKEKMAEMGADLKEHNSYAKQLPEIQGKLDLINEKVSVANKRIDDLESFQKEVTRKLI